MLLNEAALMHEHGGRKAGGCAEAENMPEMDLIKEKILESMTEECSAQAATIGR